MTDTERMWQYMEVIDKVLDALGIPKEPPKGSFYDLSADEDTGGEKEKKRKSGGQPGNQNARKHGYYSKHFTPEQMNELEEINYHKGLDPEIALLRVRLNALLKDPEADPDLILKNIQVLGRLVNIQRRYIYG